MITPARLRGLGAASIIVALSALAASTTAHAAQCSPRQMAGSWVAVYDGPKSKPDTKTVSVIHVDAQGKYTGTTRVYPNGKRLFVLKGRLKLAKDCMIRGVWGQKKTPDSKVDDVSDISGSLDPKKPALTLTSVFLWKPSGELDFYKH